MWYHTSKLVLSTLSTEGSLDAAAAVAILGEKADVIAMKNVAEKTTANKLVTWSNDK